MGHCFGAIIFLEKLGQDRERQGAAIAEMVALYYINHSSFPFHLKIGLVTARH